MIPRKSTPLSEPIAPTEAINTATDFARFFAASGKPASQWAIGAEIELFGFTRDSLERINPDQVQTVIDGFAAETISRVIENNYVTEALLGARGQGSGAGDCVRPGTPDPACGAYHPGTGRAD